MIFFNTEIAGLLLSLHFMAPNSGEDTYFCCKRMLLQICKNNNNKIDSNKDYRDRHWRQACSYQLFELFYNPLGINVIKYFNMESHWRLFTSRLWFLSQIFTIPDKINLQTIVRETIVEFYFYSLTIFIIIGICLLVLHVNVNILSYP